MVQLRVSMRTRGVLNMELMKPTEVTPEPYKRVVARVEYKLKHPKIPNAFVYQDYGEFSVYMDADGQWWHSTTEPIPIAGRVVWWKPSW